MKKEHIILIEDWSIPQLYKSDFWNNLISTLESSRSEYSNMDVQNVVNPIIEGKLRKDQMIEFLWEILLPEHKVSFFENEYTVFYIWANDIVTENLIKLHDLLINREMSRVPDLISSTGVYKQMVESRNKAFSDMNSSQIDTKDVVLMKFYDKLSDEEVISLNTPDYVMVSGIDPVKVKGLNEKLLEEKYILLYTMDFRYDGGEKIPIYVFHPAKK